MRLRENEISFMKYPQMSTNLLKVPKNPKELFLDEN